MDTKKNPSSITIRRNLLQLSTKVLMKKCKKHNIKIPTNSSKQDMVDLLLSILSPISFQQNKKESEIKNQTKKPKIKKTKYIETIIEEKGLCDTNHWYSKIESRGYIFGHSKMDNGMIYRYSNHHNRWDHISSLPEQYKQFRMIGINYDHSKLYWYGRQFETYFIILDIIQNKWKEYEYNDRYLASPFYIYPVIASKQFEFHVFKGVINKRNNDNIDNKQLMHMMWSDDKHEFIQLKSQNVLHCDYDERPIHSDKIFYNETLNMIMAFKFKVKDKKWDSIHIRYCDLNNIAHFDDFKWNPICVEMPSSENYSFKWFIGYGSILVFFQCWNKDIYCMDLTDCFNDIDNSNNDQKHKKWYKSHYKCPGKEQFKYSFTSLFITKDNIVHIITDTMKRHIRFPLIDIIPKEICDKQQILLLINGFVAQLNKSRNYNDVVQLIFSYYNLFI